MKNFGETIINPYFIFKGKNSRAYNITVLSMPDVIRGEENVEQVEVPGRSGVLHISDNTFKPVSKSISCAIRDRQKIDDICAWLVGSGDLILSTEPTKVYRAYIGNQIDISAMMKTFQRFLLTFDCFPFKYSVNYNDEKITLTTPMPLYNRGTIYSQPVITVYGTGSVTVTINGWNYGLNIENGFIIINSEIYETYDDTGGKNNNYIPPDDYTHYYPRFEVGKNEISWSGNVEKIEIQPMWRWI